MIPRERPGRTRVGPEGNQQLEGQTRWFHHVVSLWSPLFRDEWVTSFPWFFQGHCFNWEEKGWAGLVERVENYLQHLWFFLRDLKKIHNELFRDTSLWSKLHWDRQLNTNWNSKIVGNLFSSCAPLTIAASCLTFLRHIAHAPIVTLWMGVESDAENEVHGWMGYSCLKIWGGGGKVIH